MVVYDTNFVPTDSHVWNGKTLTNKLGVSAHCIRNIGNHKLFVYKQWGGNGFGNDCQYHVVNMLTNEVLSYKGLPHHKLASKIANFFEGLYINH